MGLVSTFLTLLLRGDLRLRREVESAEALLTKAESAIAEERAAKKELEGRLNASTTATADLQAATAETARQQAAVIDMLLARKKEAA